MYYGACYYPEHWPRQRWEMDVDLMKEAGFNVVRLAEFAWARMEPKDGLFDFSWLDMAIELIEKRGIQVILGTPTAGPPKWLMDKHPDIYQRDKQGHAREFGTRRHYCFNNENFHKHTKVIVTQMAKHYKDNSNVFSWQIDNEFGGINTTRCYCSNCRSSFQNWLKNKYSTIEKLNDAWGTIFSSQTFNSWEQVHLPHYSVHQSHNPGLVLDFNRFSSDSVVKYQKIQVDILREICPNHVLTTNIMGSYNEMDYYRLTADLDVVSLDIYPIMKKLISERAFRTAANHDMTRGFKRQNYWIMEHQSGTPGSSVLAPTPKPGELRRWTYQSIARGADAIVYFRWRTISFGLEEYWHGILQHHGQPGRVYEEVKQVGRELLTLSSLLKGTILRSKAAIVRCFDNEWAFEIQPHVQGYEYKEHVAEYYRYFYNHNIQVDFISPEFDFDHYKVLIIPNLMMSIDSVVKKIVKFVQDGGYIIMDFRTGAKEMNNRMMPLKLPGRYTKLLGIEIDDYGIIDTKQGIEISFCDGNNLLVNKADVKAEKWYDVIELIEAKAVALFNEDYFAGFPAITCNTYGKGKAYYIGTELNSTAMTIFLDKLCQDVELKPILPNLPSGVEAVCRIRSSNNSRAQGNEFDTFIFVINHNPSTVLLNFTEVYMEVLSGFDLSGQVELKANDVIVLGC